jgi:hypothetical protein
MAFGRTGRSTKMRLCLALFNASAQVEDQEPGFERQ